MNAQQLVMPPFDSSILYYHQFWNLFYRNQLRIGIANQLTQKNKQLKGYVETILTVQQELSRLVKLKNRKKNRRLACEIDKNYDCPYDRCYKVYGSDVSLNLHIKLKHNGGNKTDREKLAVRAKWVQRSQFIRLDQQTIGMLKIYFNQHFSGCEIPPNNCKIVIIIITYNSLPQLFPFNSFCIPPKKQQQIILSRTKNLPPPQMRLNLPPGFVQLYESIMEERNKQGLAQNNNNNLTKDSNNNAIGGHISHVEGSNKGQNSHNSLSHNNSSSNLNNGVTNGNGNTPQSNYNKGNNGDNEDTPQNTTQINKNKANHPNSRTVTTPNSQGHQQIPIQQSLPRSRVSARTKNNTNKNSRNQ